MANPTYVESVMANGRTLLIASVTAFIFIITFGQTTKLIPSQTIQITAGIWALSVLSNLFVIVFGTDYLSLQGSQHEKRFGWSYTIGVILFVTGLISSFVTIFTSDIFYLIMATFIAIFGSVIFFSVFKLRNPIKRR